jgi:uncharacterized protein YjbJ (UPF0337 family)
MEAALRPPGVRRNYATARRSDRGPEDALVCLGAKRTFTANRRMCMSEYVNKAKGKVKQAVGDLTGNVGLKEEGVRDERKGQVEGVIQDVKDVVKGVAKDAKRQIKGTP